MPSLDTELTTDFSSGAFDSVAATAFPGSAVALLKNGRILPDGTVQRRGGSRRTHATALNSGAQGYGASRFTTAAGVDQIVVFAGNRAYRSEDEGATWTDITPETVPGTSDLQAGYWDFTVMRVGAVNYLFCANGDTEVWRWNGTTMDALPNAPSGVKFVEVFNGRLYAAGHNGVVVQASRIADPATWATPDGLLVQILAHGETDLTGMVQLGSHLLVHSRTSTSYIDGYGEQTLIVAAGAQGLSRSVGCIAFRSIACVGDNAICWLSERGVEYFSSSTGLRLVSRSVQGFFENLNRAQILNNPGQPTAVYNAESQEYLLAVSTTGVRNDRTLVLNLVQNAEWQRRGPRAACSFDDALAEDGALLLGIGADNYLATSADGVQSKSDALGYMELAADESAGVGLAVDATDYLGVVTNDTVPAVLFLAPGSDQPGVVYSVGYDGFVRQHFGATNDDEASDSTGGAAFAMTLVSRPFLFGRPRQKKKARVIHLSTLQDVAASFTVALRVRGQTVGEQTVAMQATALEQPTRRRVMTSGVGDAPQVEVRTTDEARVALVGVSAALLKEPVG